MITASAISLNVADPAASAAFAERHLGFREEMSADGFVSLSRDDAGFNLVYLRTGLETSTTSARAWSARASRSPRRSRRRSGASATSRSPTPTAS